MRHSTPIDYICKICREHLICEACDGKIRKEHIVCFRCMGLEGKWFGEGDDKHRYRSQYVDSFDEALK